MIGSTWGTLRDPLALISSPKTKEEKQDVLAPGRRVGSGHCALLQAVYLRCSVVDVFPHASHTFSIISVIFLKPVLCPHLYSISF